MQQPNCGHGAFTDKEIYMPIHSLLQCGDLSLGNWSGILQSPFKCALESGSAFMQESNKAYSQQYMNMLLFTISWI